MTRKQVSQCESWPFGIPRMRLVRPSWRVLRRFVLIDARGGASLRVKKKLEHAIWAPPPLPPGKGFATMPGKCKFAYTKPADKISEQALIRRRTMQFAHRTRGQHIEHRVATVQCIFIQVLWCIGCHPVDILTVSVTVWDLQSAIWG